MNAIDRYRMANLLLTLALVAACNSVNSAPPPNYPNKPIRLIVPTSPGSPPDLVARILGERLTATLGQRVVIDNRPGASGTIGLAAVAKAAPDGYTIGMIAMPYTVAPSLYLQLQYDTARDLAPVSLAVWSTNMLIVRSNSAWRSLRDLLAAAKAKPGYLTYASGGNGTPAHLAGESFRIRTGIDIRHIPFKGAPAGVAAVIGEQVDMMFATTGVVAPHIDSGKLRALAAVSPSRLAAYPKVPTIAELGIVAFDIRDWHGVVTPAGTPKEIIARLAMEIRKAIVHREAQERFAMIMMEPAPDSSPETFGALIRTELAKWAKVVREAGIRAD